MPNEHARLNRRQKCDSWELHRQFHYYNVTCVVTLNALRRAAHIKTPSTPMQLLQKIIRNEAMKQDPPEIYGWRVFLIAATVCLGGILFGVDTGTMGGVLVLPTFKKEFGLDDLDTIESANLSANIVSALQAGCFLGAVLAWPVADSKGRRTALIFAPVIATAGIAIQAGSSGHLGAVYAGR